jgi:hypothetical protein
MMVYSMMLIGLAYVDDNTKMYVKWRTQCGNYYVRRVYVYTQ